MLIDRRSVLVAGLLGLGGGTAGLFAAGLSDRAEHSAATGAGRPIAIGHLINLTHPQPLVARALTRIGTPFLEPRIGTSILWHAYRAGTAVSEAIFARLLDACYIGPGPLLNGYIRSKGTEMRLLAGAVRGGAALVIHSGSTLRKPADFRGKRIATPAFGNSQDIALRNWLIEGGLRITQTAGDAIILPTENPDQLAVFQARGIDAVWTVEPWVSRLVREGGGRVLVDETDAVTTLLAGSARFVSERQDLARKLVAAHGELTSWIVANPDTARDLATDELGTIMGRPLDTALIAAAWPRLRLDHQLDRPAVSQLVENTKRVKFVRRVPELAPFFAEIAQ